MQTKIAKWRRKCAPWHGLALLWGGQLLISSIFIIAFTQYFLLARRIVTLHLAFVASGLLALTLALSVLVRLGVAREKGLGRLVLTLLPAAMCLAILGLYVGDWISQVVVGTNLNYLTVREYIGQLGLWTQQFNLYRWYAVAVGVAVLVMAFYWWLAPRLQRSFQYLLFPDGAFSQHRKGHRKLFLLLVIAAFASGLYGFIRHERTTRVSRFLEHEPFTVFFFEDYFFRTTPHRERVAQQDQAARAAYPRQQNFQRRNVILIIVDALRADHLPLYGYNQPTTPFLSELAQSGKLRQVDMALAQCPYTLCGVPAIMASKEPQDFTPQNFMLPHVLRDVGYETYFILAGSHSWRGLRRYYGDEMTLFFDGRLSHRYPLSDDRALLEGLERVPAAHGTPAYFQFHLMSAHILSNLLQDNWVKQPDSKVWGILFDYQDPEARARLVAGYDKGVRQADDFIRQIFAALDAKGYLQNGLVVIAGDHGEALGEHNHLGHTFFLYQEDLRIPLLIYEDRPAQYRSLKHATQIDIAPTVLERLGLVRPTVWAGRSLLSEESAPDSFHENGLQKIHAIVSRRPTGVYKYILALDANRAPESEQLYELTSDPHEQNNLITTAEPSLVQELRAQLESKRRQK